MNQIAFIILHEIERGNISSEMFLKRQTFDQNATDAIDVSISDHMHI